MKENKFEEVEKMGDIESLLGFLVAHIEKIEHPPSKEGKIRAFKYLKQIISSQQINKAMLNEFYLFAKFWVYSIEHDLGNEVDKYANIKIMLDMSDRLIEVYDYKVLKKTQIKTPC